MKAKGFLNDKTLVFFRNDDVGVDSDPYRFPPETFANIPGQQIGAAIPDSLNRLVDIFLANDAPLDLSVIPYFLTPSLAEQLLFWASQGKINLLQHGWKHVDYGCKEFSTYRTFEEQRDDIQNGRKILQDLLGEAFTPIFVPPSNKYDQNTLQILNQLDFCAISAGAARNWCEYAINRFCQIAGVKMLGTYPITRHCGNADPLAEFSISLDFAATYKERGRIKTDDQLAKDFAKCRHFYPVVGVMLHHWMFCSVRDFRTLENLIGQLKVDASIQMISLGELSQRGKPVEPESKRRT